MCEPSAAHGRRARRRRAPTPADLGLLFALAVLLPFLPAGRFRPGGAAVVLVRAADGRERLFDAGQDGDVEIPGPLGATRLRFQGGAVRIAGAPCPRRLCQRLGRLRGPGRSLVCVPNRVVVRFAGHGADVDAVTR